MKKYLITGLLIWIPLVITLWVLKLIVDSLDQTLLLLPIQLRTESWLGIHVPGLGVLLKTQKRAMTGGQGLRLVNANKSVRDVLRYAGFDRIFEVV